MKFFWTNTIWFIILGIITILELVYVIKKSNKHKRTFAFYLSVCGMTFLFEMLLYGFLKSYDYYPMIFDNVSRLDDGLAGNLFSQFSISATALLICVLDLKFYWNIILALIYGGIEELFLFLGIYKQYWYRTWMTVAGLIVMFSIVKFMYNKFVKDRPKPIFKYILIYFAAFVPHTDLFGWPFRLIWGPSFSESLLPDAMNSAFLLFSISFNILCISSIIIYFLRAKWWQTGLVVLFLYSVHIIAFLAGLIAYRDPGLMLLFATVEIVGIFIFIYIVDKLYGYEQQRLA